MSTARELRDRQRRLRTSSPATTQPAQHDPRTFRASANIIPVVIRSTTAEVTALGVSDRCQVQQVRYISTPPVADDIEAIGPLRLASPWYGLSWANFAVYAWGPDDPLVAGVSIMLAMEDRGSLVLVKPLCPPGTALDPNQAVSGCNFG